jgi:hypothetical protein
VVEFKITGLDKPPNKGRISQMADDRMRKDNLDKNMGGAGQKDQDKYGQKTPGRSQHDDDLSQGQRGAGQRDQGHMKEDPSKSDKSGGQGGQNRPNR